MVLERAFLETFRVMVKKVAVIEEHPFLAGLKR